MTACACDVHRRALWLSVALAVPLAAGCGRGGDPGPAPGPEPTPTPSPTGSPPGQTATLEIVGFGHFGDAPAQGSFPVEAIVRHRTPERVDFRVDGRLINTDRRWPYTLGSRATWDSWSGRDDLCRPNGGEFRFDAPIE
jgi:hypothetical protein